MVLYTVFMERERRRRHPPCCVAWRSDTTFEETVAADELLAAYQGVYGSSSRYFEMLLGACCGVTDTSATAWNDRAAADRV